MANPKSEFDLSMESGRDNLRVLLCTSETSDLPMIAAALSMSREVFELRVAHGYSESELEFQNGTYDVVILDVEMGERRALRLLDRYSAEAEAKPIIAMLSDPNDELEHEAIQLGAIDLLIRDEAQPGRIERAVRHAVERGRLRHSSVFPPRRSVIVERSAAEQRRDALIESLPAAFENGEIVLHYQPKVRTSDERLIGAEALMRWTSEVHGVVSPMEFVPLLEETGLVNEAGAWAIAEGARQARLFRERGLDLRIAVNVSARQFMHTDLAGLVAKAIDDEGIPPRSLELELTESVLLESTEQNRKKVAALRELGCLVAIDDFGTGFATLNYIRRFPMDVLKIDRTFIRNLPYDAENTAITNAITALGNSLGLEVVAEGVETEEEFEYLRSIGCPVVQGFLFSAAMDAETLVRWEQERRAKKTASSAPSTEPI